MFRAFNGKLLVADERPVVLEGAWERDKVVIMAFPTKPPPRRFASRRSIGQSQRIAKPAPTRSSSR